MRIHVLTRLAAFPLYPSLLSTETDLSIYTLSSFESTLFNMPLVLLSTQFIRSLFRHNHHEEHLAIRDPGVLPDQSRYRCSLIPCSFDTNVALFSLVQCASIQSISRGERTKLCEATQAACKEACKGNSSTKSNNQPSCDADKLVWSCECARNDMKIGNRTAGTFPIPEAMCRLDRDLCEKSCTNIGEHMNHGKICRMQCSGSYPCGTDHTPFYNGTQQLDYNSHDNLPMMKEQQQTASATPLMAHLYPITVVSMVIIYMIYVG